MIGIWSTNFFFSLFLLYVSGSKASVTELADFIVAAGTGPNADKVYIITNNFV